jgi:hypothetical protein
VHLGCQSALLISLLELLPCFGGLVPDVLEIIKTLTNQFMKIKQVPDLCKYRPHFCSKYAPL